MTGWQGECSQYTTLHRLAWPTAPLGLHTIIYIKNSHKRRHRKCLNTMCVRSDVFSTANMEQKELSRLFVYRYILKIQKERKKILWYHCCCKLLYHCSGHFHILWQPWCLLSLPAALFTSMHPDWISSTLDIQFSQLTHSWAFANRCLWSSHTWASCCWLWCEQKKTYNQLMCQFTLCIIYYLVFPDFWRDAS